LQFREDQGLIDAALVRSLLKVAERAPLIAEKTLHFLLEIGCIEGIQILSRTLTIPQDVKDEVL
jgi:hypothetical protein